MLKEKTKKWKRNCPTCGEELSYTEKYSRDDAEKRNTKCNSCAKGGENNPMCGKKRTFTDEWKKNISESLMGDKNPAKRPEVRKKISESLKGKKRSEEMRKRISETLKGIKRSEKTKQKMRKPKSKEARKNMRLSAIKRIERENGQMSPNYNPRAIPVIKKEAKKYNITDLQHAENGGEFQFRGFYADGFSKEKNIWFEYYEKAHEKQKERDERRKKEIEKYLGCTFIVIKENNVL